MFLYSRLGTRERGRRRGPARPTKTKPLPEPDSLVRSTFCDGVRRKWNSSIPHASISYAICLADTPALIYFILFVLSRISIK